MAPVTSPILSTFHLALTRRCLFFLLASLVIVVIFFGTALQDPNSMTISEAFQSKDSIKQYLNQLSLPSTSSCPSSCPSDPFSKPGMLYWHPKGLANETRWLPFSGPDAAWEMPSDARIKDAVPRKTSIPPEVFGEASPQYTARLHEGGGVPSDKDWDWLRNRTLILMDDRNNVEQFCVLVQGKYKSWGWHTGGFCKVSRLNFVIMNFFLYGMVDEEDLGFPPHAHDEPPYTFEHRIENLIIPLAKKDGMARKPDLVLLSSLFWDENFLRRYGLDHRNREKARGFLWGEIAWHRSRLRELFTFVRGVFGQDLPMMFRTRHIRAKMGADQLLHVAQLDQSGRAASRDMGVRLFTWGEKLEGYMQYSDNDQHFRLGPNTYLFGDMVLFYLKRAVTPGCWACGQDQHY